MPPEPEARLRVLIANEGDARLDTITGIVERLGHEIVGGGVEIADVGPLSRSTGAEIALSVLALMASRHSNRSPRSSTKPLAR